MRAAATARKPDIDVKISHIGKPTSVYLLDAAHLYSSNCLSLLVNIII